MSDTYRIYQYDYAAYYTGNFQDIPNDQGYPSQFWTTAPLPEIPNGQFAVFDGTAWFLTYEQEPPRPPEPEPVVTVLTGPEATGPTPTVI